MKNKLLLIKNIGIKMFILTALKNMFYINHYYILQRGLEGIKDNENKRNKFVLQKATDDDINKIIDSVNLYDDYSRKEIIIRLLFYKSGFKNCYIVKSMEGDIAYIQWLIYPMENEIIRKCYKNRYYELREKQVMVENVFTYPKYRGLGLMQDVTNELLRIAGNQGYRHVIIYVRSDLIDVINDRIKNGFKITKMITEYKMFGYCKRFL